jgi:hypothetical protein
MSISCSPRRHLAPRLVVGGVVTLMVSLLLVASPAYAAPVIFPTSLPQGEVGESYSATLTATYTPPVTWAITGGSLPPGLNLNTSNGVISGEPTTAGSYTFLAQITDNSPGTAQQWFLITITETPLRFVTTSLPQGTEGTSYSQTISVSGGTSPYTWEISSGTLPNGLTLKSTNGRLSGTPKAGSAGTYYFTVTVTDDSSPQQSEERDFTLVIAQGLYKSTVTIGPGLVSGQTQVFVDGELMATLRGGESTHFDFDLNDDHTIRVSANVTDPTRTNVRFTANDDSVTVSEDSPNAYFDYKAEYQIDLRSDPAQATPIAGSGWYNQGEIITLSASDTINNKEDTQYRFSHWLLPSGETISDNNFSVAVTTAGNIIAVYDTYYRLTFATNPPGITQLTGSGWYKADYDLRTSAPAEVNASTAGTQYRFSSWVLPTGETSNDDNLNFTVSAPGTVTANYDTYYLLTLNSKYGSVGGGTWYKAGSPAQWSLDSQEVPMPGVLGSLGGRLRAVSQSGTQIMDGPKSVNIVWNPDYSRPILFFALLALGIGLGVFFGTRRKHAPPAPVPAGPAQALPPPQTTVVMLGDTPRLSAPTTKEQLLDKFSELLDKYEQEVRGGEAGKPPELNKAAERMLAEGQTPIVEGESAPTRGGALCNYTGKRLLRVVAGPWRQMETRVENLPPDEMEAAGGGVGVAVVWTRDTYNEWRVMTCSLPQGHRGIHQGNLRMAYTLLNTITEKQIYAPGETLTPPSPHFTDGMPEVEVTTDQVVRYEQLPSEDLP